MLYVLAALVDTWILFFLLAPLYAAMVMMFGSTLTCPDPRAGLSLFIIVFPVVRMGHYSTRADLAGALKEIPVRSQCSSRWQQMLALFVLRLFTVQPFMH